SAIRYPSFRAIEHPAFICSPGARFHAARVGSVIGFSQTETPDLFALCQWRQPLPLLIFGSESENGIHHKRALNADEAAQAAVAALQFLHNEAIRNVVHICAAVFFGKVA